MAGKLGILRDGPNSRLPEEAKEKEYFTNQWRRQDFFLGRVIGSQQL